MSFTEDDRAEKPRHGTIGLHTKLRRCVLKKTNTATCPPTNPIPYAAVEWLDFSDYFINLIDQINLHVGRLLASRIDTGSAAKGRRNRVFTVSKFRNLQRERVTSVRLCVCWFFFSKRTRTLGWKFQIRDTDLVLKIQGVHSKACRAKK